MITTLDTVPVFLSSFLDQRYRCCILLFFAYPKCRCIVSDIFIIYIFPKWSDSYFSWLITLSEVHRILLVLILLVMITLFQKEKERERENFIEKIKSEAKSFETFKFLVGVSILFVIQQGVLIESSFVIFMIFIYLKGIETKLSQK